MGEPVITSSVATIARIIADAPLPSSCASNRSTATNNSESAVNSAVGQPRSALTAVAAASTWIKIQGLAVVRAQLSVLWQLDRERSKFAP